MAEYNSIVNMHYIVIINSSADRHLSWFHFMVAVNRDIINMDVQVSLWPDLGVYQGLGYLGLIVLLWILLWNLHTYQLTLIPWINRIPTFYKYTSHILKYFLTSYFSFFENFLISSLVYLFWQKFFFIFWSYFHILDARLLFSVNWWRFFFLSVDFPFDMVTFFSCAYF